MCGLCEGQWGRGFGVGILLLQMTSSSFGGSGGPEICDGPEIIELLCGCGVVCVKGLVNGDSVSVSMGQMCCLLNLYLQPWASMMYDLGV